MTYQDLIDHFGSQIAVARALGAAQSSVSEWQQRGVPDDRQLEAQRVTDGKLRADPAIIKKYTALLGGAKAARA